MEIQGRYWVKVFDENSVVKEDGPTIRIKEPNQPFTIIIPVLRIPKNVTFTDNLWELINRWVEVDGLKAVYMMPGNPSIIILACIHETLCFKTSYSGMRDILQKILSRRMSKPNWKNGF